MTSEKKIMNQQRNSLKMKDLFYKSTRVALILSYHNQYMCCATL
jgi:hypothetical protein